MQPDLYYELLEYFIYNKTFRNKEKIDSTTSIFFLSKMPDFLQKKIKRLVSCYAFVIAKDRSLSSEIHFPYI